jgi:malonyl-CoA decarboxylase
VSNERTNVWDRALRQLSFAWQDVADAARIRSGRRLRADLPDDDLERIRDQVAECIAGVGGEVLARGRAAAIGNSYLSLDEEGKRRFLVMLARDFEIDMAAVEAEASAMMQAEDIETKRALAQSLRDYLQPPRMRLLTQFNGLPDGVKFLVDMRADAMAWSRDEPVLLRLANDLKRLLTGWFDIGFLELKRMTWSSPAALLEKLIVYEAVHRIASWDDLKNRLETDRRLFAFFHPRMPDEPLIFVEVALVNGMADNVQRLLDADAPILVPGSADTAIFYSISNTQKGLAGISLGDFLIKRVVDVLMAELPNLKTFATLSPLPGFRRWLDHCLEEGEEGILRPDEIRKLGVADEPAAQGKLRDALTANGEALEPFEDVMIRLAAKYLVLEKRNGRPIDPVARFHLANGARVERLNWAADRSDNGARQSAGLMVNYLYRLDQIRDNHDRFVGTGAIAMSSAIRALAKRSA